MEFDKIYYNEFEYLDKNIYSIDNSKDGFITYFLFIKEYIVENNKIIIEDIYLNRLKDKFIRKEKYSNYKEILFLYFDNGYFVSTSPEDIQYDDLELTPDEFAIKNILE